MFLPLFFQIDNRSLFSLYYHCTISKSGICLMKWVIFITTLILLAACHQRIDKTRELQAQIDSLQNKLNNTYKPGFGEFMGNIQLHHAKLWFAGINKNWRLADFEIQEIQETLDDIKKYDSDRPETKDLRMIKPPLDSISNAVEQQNLPLFKSSFIVLTKTCNNCHRATDHDFNVITTPSVPPIGNQIFKSQ